MSINIDIQKARAQDPDTYNKIWKYFHPLLLRYCVNILKDREQAEDVVQDTMLRAWQALPKTSVDLKLSGWLHTIAYHRCVDILRMQMRRGTLSLADIPDIPRPEGLNLSLEYAGILNSEECHILTLRYAGRMGYAELARAVGLPEHRVRRLLREAEDKIRQAGAPDGS